MHPLLLLEADRPSELPKRSIFKVAVRTQDGVCSVTATVTCSDEVVAEVIERFAGFCSIVGRSKRVS